jgi:eukaryotic-like serine/threonine-protein kinase
MPTNLERARELFLHAVGKVPPDQWEAYVAEACGADAELEQRLKHMLQVHREAGSFMEKPIVQPMPTIDEPIRERPGTVIGPYKLLEQIGEGGFGVVFMADQTEPVRRKVALKILKPGMDTRQVVARFEAERQALAIMDHPNIARVFGGGATGGEPGSVSSGRPYFVMELVKGVPITQFCDEQKLSPRQRLELFIPVCQAVQHAHQKGIIHRDLKPSNVLVSRHDATPVVKVIDFGVAKALGQELTDKTLFTGIAQMIGTPLYMSPEQAGMSDLDVDTRSDIYSLGVLLYELLTGTTPFAEERFKKAAYDEIRRIIREEDPPKPSTRLSESKDSLPSISAQRQTEPAKLTKLVRGELDWIVMKALEKDRNRRYETANGFAMDVQRYLADEPVLACPPSMGYRLRKFVRRHRVALATVSLIVVSLVLGSGISIWQAIRANRAAEAERLAKVDAQTKEAEANAVVKFFEDKVLAAGRPKGEAGGLGHAVSLRDAVRASLQSLATSFKDQPLVEARLRRTLGTTFHFLGDSSQGAEQLEQARVLFMRHRGPDHPDTLWCMQELAMNYAILGRHTEAISLYEETLATQRRVLGPDHPDTLRGMCNLAISYAALSRHAEAVKLLEETLATQKRVLGPDHPDTLKSMNNLTNSYAALNRPADALRLREEALIAFKRMLPADHPDTLLSMSNLGLSYFALRRHAEAVKLFEETLAAQKRVLPADHPDTLKTMHCLATSYAALNRYADAVNLHEETLAARKRVLPPDHTDTLHSMNNLANSYYVLNRYAEALKLYEETLAAQKRVLPPDHPDMLRSMHNLANSYAVLSRHAEALKLREETLAARKRVLPPDHPDTLKSMAALAQSYTALNRHAEARPLIDEILAKADRPGVHARLVPQAISLRWEGCRKSGDVAGCRATVEMLEKRQPTDAASLYDAACYRAVTASLQAKTKEPDAVRLARQDADMAMAWLAKAVAAGWTDAAHMKNDTDLDFLRDRKDFQKLLAELETKPNKE